MKTDRRTFLKQLGALALTFACNPLKVAAQSTSDGKRIRRVTILHTNDVHSHIDPILTDSTNNILLGGFARRKAYIDSVRDEGVETLVFECGDMFQGTPYFNIYKGKLEIELMNKMGVDAVTLGNHEFDNGLDELYKRIQEADFAFLNANYDFKTHDIASVIKPYRIFEKGGIKIGVFGLGVRLEGLVSKTNYGQTEYHDPIATANRIAKELHDMGCELIIAITHIGYEMRDLPDDITLAKQSEYIDIILGGHTHTLLYHPTEIENLQGKTVVINQVGYGGINMGRLDVVIGSDDKVATNSRLTTMLC